MWGVIAFFALNNSSVNVSDTYRATFGDTLIQCEQKCLFDVRCYGYWYEYSHLSNTGCYLKGEPTNFNVTITRLRPSIVGIKIRSGKKPWN